MKVEFSKEQYETLLKLTYLGNWMINANRVPDEWVGKYLDLESYLFSKAKEFGLEELVDEKDGMAAPSKTMDEDAEISEYRVEYDEEVFWAELCDTLALRDILTMVDQKDFEEMDPLERVHLIGEYAADYAETFEDKGIESIQVKGFDPETVLKATREKVRQEAIEFRNSMPQS